MSAMSSPILGQIGPGEHHVDLKPSDNSEAEDALRAAETVYQLAVPQNPQELLIYPEGEVDAVTITERDVEGLQPGRFLSNNIVDFYIRFLERGLSPERGNRFYFFNSFFFTKLLQSTASTGIDPCKVDYGQLRKWTEEVNLFAKDYVFIPILKSSHWSLVIICHLSNLTRPPGEMMRSPCVVHLDPIEGQHESFEGLIRSYVLQAWMERFQVSSNGDQLLALCQMKYVEAKVLGKRKHIQNLIHELSGISQKHARKRKAIQEVLQSTQNLRFLLFHEGNSEACIKDVQTFGPTFFNGQGFEIIHASTHEDALDAQGGQSTLISRGNIEPTEYEDKSGSLPPKQQYVEPKVQTGGSTHFNGSIFVAKHVSTHEDAIDVQHQQSSGISRLDYEPLDGLELRHAESRRVTKNFSDMLQHPMLEEVPCMDLSEVQKGKHKRGRKMTKEETWVLLSCMVEGGRFCKGSGGRTHWNLICEEIGKKLGSLLSADQCRLRYDTLLKAYKAYKKYCMKTGKTFSMITEAERLDLKLATTLSEEMYTTMDEICTKANISEKRMKLSSNVCNDLHPLSSPDSLAPNPPPISRGRSFEDEVVVLDSAYGTIEVALRNVIPASVFSSFNEDLQSTLLNLVQECSLPRWMQTVRNGSRFGLELLRRLQIVRNGKRFGLERVCRRLAILQDCQPREILKHVLKLWKLDFVNVVGMVFEEGNDLAHIHLLEDNTWFLKQTLYEKISEEVFGKDPHLKTYCYCTSFPMELSSRQYIRVLTLHECHEVEHLDLREFPSLQSLAIRFCPKFNLVTGWEVATGLGSLEIRSCGAYHNFPNLRYLFSLKEISLIGRIFDLSTMPWQLSQFSQCANLRRLEIWNDESLSKIADLENLKDLKFLEFLSLRYCPFSNIQGLSGLQALTTLTLDSCSLRTVPGLGWLKGLTYLSMSNSSVEDVVGVGELHLLTWLDLCDCNSLKGLPFLGHLKALVHLDLRGTGVKEIPGKEDLISLKTLHWDIK